MTWLVWSLNRNTKINIWTIPNIITIIRILFVPLFVVFLLSPWTLIIDSTGNLFSLNYWVSLIIFILLSATDSLDGYLARSRNEVSDFGKFMDPLADKILVFAAFISMVELKILPTWVVLIVVFREFIISGIRMLSASKGVVIAASWYGKAKTVTQIVSLSLFLFNQAISYCLTDDVVFLLNSFAWFMLIISLILTIISMVDYIYNARLVFSEHNNIDINELAAEVIELAKVNNLKIGTAESLTGGLLCSTLVNVPGASNVVCGGIVSYMYSVKENLLFVNAKHLKEHGAVNKEVALKMAQSGCKKLKCDICISTTGIAGPDTDEFNTAIGTVFIGLSSNDNTSYDKFIFSGDRQEIRNKTIYQSLLLLKKHLLNL